MKFKVFSELEYQVYIPSTFIFNIQVAKTASQTILEEDLAIEPHFELEAFNSQNGTRFLRLEIKNAINFKIAYNAIVETNYTIIDEHRLQGEAVISKLDAEVIPYLFPSRYCQSDKLQRLATKEFGGITDDYAKVVAITDWIFNNVEYLSGSTNSSTSALDTISERAGVCRDFAHLGIALCRALSIPARYFTGYAFKLNPPDFHACFEAYVGGNWLFFDATRLIPINGLVKIANGRDAADAAVASIFGNTFCNYINVSCEAIDDNFEPYNYWDNKEGGLCYG
ncbi:MAG: transglutaminase family protein [Pedobacter sp.]|nr:transglutaminase family protein [Chitinophagaceae bacterium]